MPSELTFNVDGTGKTAVKTGYDAKVHQILTLITMKKNTDPFNPDKGVDINSYRFRLDDNETKSDLSKAIDTQISTYTNHKITDISVQIAQQTILVGLKLVGSDDVMLFINTEANKTKFEVLADKTATTS